MNEVKNAPKEEDQDSGKGAVEQDSQNHGGNMSEQGQLGHRDQNSLLKSSDTDFLSREKTLNIAANLKTGKEVT